MFRQIRKIQKSNHSFIEHLLCSGLEAGYERVIQADEVPALKLCTLLGRQAMNKKNKTCNHAVMGNNRCYKINK